MTTRKIEYENILEKYGYVCGTCRLWEFCPDTERWRIHEPCSGQSGAKWESSDKKIKEQYEWIKNMKRKDLPLLVNYKWWCNKENRLYYLKRLKGTE